MITDSMFRLPSSLASAALGRPGPRLTLGGARRQAMLEAAHVLRHAPALPGVLAVKEQLLEKADGVRAITALTGCCACPGRG